MSEILRTPDECFANLPDYDFDPNYVEVNGVRLHYVELNPAGGETVLLLHGEPSWSFLYRKMIPGIAAAGHRIIAPDLVGFGRSDKPTDPNAYTYQSHMDWMTGFVKALNLQNITLFCQDWGGLLGLRMAAEHGERFARIVAANTFLPTGDQTMPDEFFKWREFSQKVKRFDIGRVVKNGCVREMPKDVVAAYNAPYPDENYKVGARRFPALVPVTPDDPASAANRAAWEKLQQWQKPFLTAFSDSDPITKGGNVFFRRAIPGAKGQPHTTVKNGGHFLQEDCGEELADIVVNFIAATPTA